MSHDYEGTRRSWNTATRAHNTHKGDQAAFLRGGGDVLFPEELELLGELHGKRLVHLQCNSGQDSLCLARRGALVTGVDFSDEAITFARSLSQDSRIPARFEHAEVVGWLHQTHERFDVAFTSYGATGWLPDLDAWARGVARVLVPGGRLVYVEFHPLTWSLGDGGQLTGDDYFQRGPYLEPVSDYVAEAGATLGAVDGGAAQPNPHPATSYTWTFAETIDAIARAGLRIDRAHEWPYSNGARRPFLVQDGRRWVWPEGRARIPLMFGIAATRAPETSAS